MLFELAIGDAYGAGFEFRSADFVTQNNHLKNYFAHELYTEIKGKYTDDTQMSLAIAELLISGEDWNEENIIRKFIEVFKRDPRRGYSKRLYQVLSNTNTVEEFSAQIQATSQGSGAAMRACPIGLIADVDQIIEKSTLQAKTTHNTTEGIRSAIAAALIPHYFIYEQGKKEDLGKFVKKYVSGEWDKTWKDPVTNEGVICVRAAITSMMRNDNFCDLLIDCVNHTGDVDTVAAIALGAASCCKAYKNNLPQNLIYELENGSYGASYLKELDKQLILIKGS